MSMIRNQIIEDEISRKQTLDEKLRFIWSLYDEGAISAKWLVKFIVEVWRPYEQQH